MDLSALFTTPVIAVAVALIITSAWIGHAIGKSNENRRKESALTQADTAAKAAIESLQREHDEKIGILNKANTNELEKVHKMHSEQVDQLNQAHQTMMNSLETSHAGELERLGSDHSSLIDKLNAANIANINELKTRHEQQIAQINERSTNLINEIEQRRKVEIQEIKLETSESISSLKSDHQTVISDLKSEQSANLATLRQDHKQAIDDLRHHSDQLVQQAEQDRDRQIREQEERSAAEVAQLTTQVLELNENREKLSATVTDLENSLSQLTIETREAKLNNMFSVSKSGEKLIRVVRTVQELANELDETSRAVTDGEYSFFEEIKDKQDKEVVLSLTGASKTYHVDTNEDETGIGEETGPDAQGAPVNMDEDKSAADEESAAITV